MLRRHNVGEDLGGMVAGVDAVVGARDFARFVDQEADAAGIARLGIIACAVSHPERAIGVA